jgi:hypothetical protein
VAEVTITDISASRPIGSGRPIVWPISWSRCERANRVKSGMFSASVAQNPTIAVSDGQNTFQNCPSFLPPATNCEGMSIIVPKPPALSIAHHTSTRHMTILIGAENVSSQRSSRCRARQVKLQRQNARSIRVAQD